MGGAETSAVARGEGTPTRAAGGVLVVFIGVQLAQVMGALDGTIVATALPTITDDLGGFSRITWVITTYALAGVASMPIYGKLGDLYGRKRMLLGAIGLFLAASLACGAAQTLDQLLVARFVQDSAQADWAPSPWRSWPTWCPPASWVAGWATRASCSPSRAWPGHWWAACSSIT